MISFIKNKIMRNNFNKKWRNINKHNQTMPGSVFPIDLVRVGSYSYGIINIKSYNESNKTDMLIIGNFVSIADGVKFILCENHQTETITTFPLKSILFKKSFSEDASGKGSIIIEDEVWIGYGVTILSGVRIGKGAIIAAGAVVNKDIPSYSIAGGVPARIIKQRYSEDITKRLLAFRLIDLPEDLIKKNIELFYRKLSGVEDLQELELLFKQSANEKVR